MDQSQQDWWDQQKDELVQLTSRSKERHNFGIQSIIDDDLSDNEINDDKDISPSKNLTMEPRKPDTPPFGRNLFEALADDPKSENRKRQRTISEDFRKETKEGKRFCAVCRVIFHYLQQQTRKQPENIKIGVFTVFLTVMVITFLQSVLSCTPILFVKFGQKAVGAIDFTMKATTSDTSAIAGNVNYYDIDQFNNPYYPKSDWCNNCQVVDTTTNDDVYSDDPIDPDDPVDPEDPDEDKTSFKYCKPKTWDKQEC